MIGDDKYFFQGFFDGNGHRIYVDIFSDNDYVGLFSRIGSYHRQGSIDNLSIAGRVQGGYESK